MFHKENFQNHKGDLIKVIKSVIMMKNIKKNGCLRDKINGNI